MKTGYQIYVKRNGENTYQECGLNNWYWKEEEALEKLEALNRTWRKYGNEYIIVKLG